MIDKLFEPSERANQKAYFEMRLAESLADRKRYAQSAGRANDTNARFRMAAINGDIIAASKLALSKESNAKATDHLLIYILAMRSDLAAQAKLQLGAAIEKLRAGSGSERDWAAWLSGESVPTLDELVSNAGDFENHYLYLLAIERRLPTLESETRKLAAKLRYKNNFYAMVTADLF